MRKFVGFFFAEFLLFLINKTVKTQKSLKTAPYQKMLKLPVLLLIIGIITASPTNTPKKAEAPTGFDDFPPELIDRVTSKFTETKDLIATHIALGASGKYPGKHQRLPEYRNLCGFDTFEIKKDLTLVLSGDKEISKECCGLIRETASLFRRIEFHGTETIISGDICIPKGI